MHLWELLYVMLLAIAAVIVVREHRRQREPLWYILGEVATTGFLCILVAAYCHAAVQQTLGWAVVVVFLITAAWEAFSWYREWRSVTEAPDLSPEENAIAQAVGVFAGAVVTFPALALGAIVSWRAL